MARRRMIELPPGRYPFDRTPQQWRDSGAPVWVFDSDAAAEVYVTWARAGYGRGVDLADGVVRRYYVDMRWLPHCVQPRYLDHVGALTAGEAQLLVSDRSARWGRPGRCRSPMLDAAADVPRWLECCRQDPGPARR
jgi:hypothetical protein